MDEPTQESTSSSSRLSSWRNTNRLQESSIRAEVSSSTWSSSDYSTPHPVTDSGRGMHADRSECDGENHRLVTSDNATEESVENSRNRERLGQFRQFTARVVGLTRECIFEFGFENELDSFVRESLAKNAMATKEWLNEIFLEHFEDVTVVVGVLRTIAHLEYEKIYPTGPTMAMAALSHRDVEVRECGIRAFENWESAEGLEYLESIRCEEAWLQDYLERVITDLGKGRQDVPAGAEN